MEFERHDIRPGKNPDVLIFTHGLGGNGYETMNHTKKLLEYVPARPRGNFILLTPHAPIHQWGAPKGGNRAWFFQVRDDEIKLNLLEQSLDALDRWIDQLRRGVILGLKPRSVCLAGFSQGGTVSVSYPLMYPKKVDYAGCFAGYIPRDLKVAPAKDYGRMLWGHGTEDYCNDYYLAEWGFPQLKALGVDFLHMHDPVGHMVHPRWFNEMLVQWLPTSS